MKIYEKWAYNNYKQQQKFAALWIFKSFSHRHWLVSKEFSIENFNKWRQNKSDFVKIKDTVMKDFLWNLTLLLLPKFMNNSHRIWIIHTPKKNEQCKRTCLTILETLKATCNKHYFHLSFLVFWAFGCLHFENFSFSYQRKKMFVASYLLATLSTSTAS